MTNPKFIISKTAPNPTVYDYWVDTEENPYGGIIKYYDGKTWDYVNNKDEQDSDINTIRNFINNLANSSDFIDTRINNIVYSADQVKISTIEKHFTIDEDGNVVEEDDAGMDNDFPINSVTTTNAGVMSAADKTKLDGIEAGANAYVLPTAAASTLGGIKVGYTTSTATSSYALLVDQNGNAYVNLNNLVNNTLTSDDINIALSAAQGKVLKGLYDELNTNYAALEARVAALENPVTQEA